ncbi:MAG TPA: hypothetical protein VM598_14615 [Bdellovibrionota bacterium]|nr:hypothetical protein [Bdellovibrionota bacterium]
MKLSLILSLLLVSAPAFAGSFKTLKITNIQTRTSATPGLVDVAVTFERDICLEDFVGLETTIINTETPPRNLGAPRGTAQRQVRIRAVGEFAGAARVCASAVARVRPQTLVIQVGAVNDPSKLLVDQVD